MFKPYEALFGYPQFVNWRFEGADKIPCDVNNRYRVDPHDPKNQIDFLTAHAAALKHQMGLGFSLTENDPFFLLDIDACLDTQTRQWSALAQQLCREFHGACLEISSSGEGLHLVGSYREIPQHRCKHTQLNIELYHTKRFVSFYNMQSATGSVAHDCTALLPFLIQRFFSWDETKHVTSADWTAQPVSGWSGPTNDEELLALARRENPSRAAFGQTVTFADLFDGHVAALADAYPGKNEASSYDASNADLALASKLAFYTGHDCERIKRLMLRSALKRDKWDREDYFHETILRGTSDRSVFYGSHRLQANVTGSPEEDVLFETLRQRIEAEGGDVTKVPSLVAEIVQISDNMRREMLKSTLLKILKDTGVYSVGLRKAIDAQLKPTYRGVEEKPENGEFYTLSQVMSQAQWPHVYERTLKPKGTYENFCAMMAAYNIQMQYDEIRKDLTITIPGVSDEIARESAEAIITSLAENNDFPSYRVMTYLKLYALQDKVNSLEQWVTSEPWDGVNRISEFFQRIQTSPKYDRGFAETLLYRWLCGALAIGLKKTDRMENVLVFVDERGGAGKTRFFSSLGPEHLIADSVLLNTRDKDSIKQAIAYWVVELGELEQSLQHSEIGGLNAYLSRKYDELRLPYDRVYKKYRRLTAYCGSINDIGFLTNASDRRFWPIVVTQIDHQHTINMQQLWAQIHHAIQQGQPWLLTEAEEQYLRRYNNSFKEISRVEEHLSAALSETKPPQHTGRDVIFRSTTAILKEVRFYGATKADLNEAAKWLRAHGFIQNERKLFLVPKELSQPPTAHAFKPVIVE